LTKSVNNLFFIGVAPAIGALILSWAFYKSSTDLWSDGSNGKILGVGEAFVIGYGFLILGVVLMFVWQAMQPEFFRRRPEVVDPGVAVSGAIAPQPAFAPAGD